MPAQAVAEAPRPRPRCRGHLSATATETRWRPSSHVVAVGPLHHRDRAAGRSPAVRQRDPLPARPDQLAGGPEGGVEADRGLERADHGQRGRRQRAAAALPKAGSHRRRASSVCRGGSRPPGSRRAARAAICARRARAKSSRASMCGIPVAATVHAAERAGRALPARCGAVAAGQPAAVSRLGAVLPAPGRRRRSAAARAARGRRARRAPLNSVPTAKPMREQEGGSTLKCAREPAATPPSFLSEVERVRWAV